ncbi:relaxase/mobilization nuclease domain-containing protein [Dyadobacter sp. LHD-138]|uniref:relaxase/mobilization nuclease domain-containing protein n=1 Tax=Dyadobacter sp. LHD-138 TaxID=3071413 RepID=UPI0027E066F4|nr:relaxase/mobilization nuclease domain-containing protein [Dyadobacter sp. LHD-138]MDQ6482607.1 relaxase/mobilization nuclease domain-containing protein [Dyadobacter sp. LHD-138]
MIGKAGLGSYAKGILEYCYYEKELTGKQRKSLTLEDVRGELIYVQHLALETVPDGRYDLDYLARQFLDNMDKNRNLTKFIWHQSFSFPPGEKPSDEQITNIATEFAREFGFAQNQMLVFRHLDTANAHFHLVANRLNYNGKNTADHFNNYARTGKFCRRMELELGLSITPQMHIINGNREEHTLGDQSKMKLKELIDRLLPSVHSLGELSEALKKQGYKTYPGRGIAFFNTKNRMKVKGSELGRQYSLANLQKRLEQQINESQNQVQKQEMTRRRKRGMHLG